MTATAYTCEIWKTIPWATDYAASSMGRIKRIVDSAKFKAGRILKASPSSRKGAYLYLVLVENDGRKRSQSVHGIICRVFHGLPEPGQEVRHRNGDGHDNREENLEWGTPKQNSADKKGHGTHLSGTRCPQAKLTAEQVAAIRAAEGAQKEIAARFGVDQPSVSRIKAGKIYPAGSVCIPA